MISKYENSKRCKALYNTKWLPKDNYFTYLICQYL